MSRNSDWNSENPEGCCSGQLFAVVVMGELRLRHNADRPCQVSVPVFASRRNLPIAQRGKYLIDFQKKWVPQGSAVSFRFPLTATQFEFADYSGNRTQSRGPIRLQVFDSTLNLFLEP